MINSRGINEAGIELNMLQKKLEIVAIMVAYWSQLAVFLRQRQFRFTTCPSSFLSMNNGGMITPEGNRNQKQQGSVRVLSLSPLLFVFFHVYVN